ncbi:unnamed protein product, partial [marine sediment metagenome]
VNACHNNNFSGNTCNANGTNGIWLNASSNNTVSANTCNDNDIDDGNNFGGIYLSGDSNNNTFTGNTSNNNNNAGGGDGHGINIVDGACNNNTVGGNTLIGNSDNEFGGSYYCLGQSDSDTTFEWVDAGVNTMDCYVWLGTYFRGSIQIIEGYDFVLNATATTKLSDPSGTLLTELWHLWSDMTVSGDIAVTGTVDGVDIAARDHAKQHPMDHGDYHTRTDVTTLNADINKHGFLKKLDNTATNFMNGTGNWSVPAGSYVDADAVQAVEDAGLVLSATKVITTADESTVFTFGRSQIGYGARLGMMLIGSHIC